jgi:hypothetical protein
MTAEERSVIEAAERFVKSYQRGSSYNVLDALDLVQAVDSLQEARKDEDFKLTKKMCNLLKKYTWSKE